MPLLDKETEAGEEESAYMRCPRAREREKKGKEGHRLTRERDIV